MVVVNSSYDTNHEGHATMDVSVLATKTRQPACWDAPEVFSDLALDYDPSDADYTHLDMLGHTILAAAKSAAEEKAVDTCFGCPLMMACESLDIEVHTDNRKPLIHGVIGGRTEAERRMRRSGRAPKTASVPNPQIAPGDRGPRNQVDDTLVARMTLAGKTSDQIAHDLDCSVRTVTRARKRMAEAITTQRIENPQPAPALTMTVINPAKATAPPARKATEPTKAQTTPVTLTSVPTKTKTTPANQPSTTQSGHSFLNGRPVSATMEAVYNHLVISGPTSMDTLKAIAAAQVDSTEALEWWNTRNSVVVDGVRTVRPSRTTTSVEDRIREGALAKAHNAIDAAIRKGRYLSKQDTNVALLPAALDAWKQRMGALVAA